MPRSITMKFTMTEVPHFRRLVDFLAEVERHADEECDVALKDLVEECREDLLRVRED